MKPEQPSNKVVPEIIKWLTFLDSKIHPVVELVNSGVPARPVRSLARGTGLADRLLPTMSSGPLPVVLADDQAATSDKAQYDARIKMVLE
jgi:hypothetical protein